MSGRVAGRVFDLLPRFVTAGERLEIAEKLWRHLRPGSNMRMRVGLDVSEEELGRALREYAAAYIRDYAIPESMSERFDWIADHDVETRQELLNHCQTLEWRIAERAVSARIPAIAGMLAQMGRNLSGTAREEIVVGKHRLTIVMDGEHEDGIRLEDPRVVPDVVSRGSTSGSCLSDDNLGRLLFWIGAFVGLGLLVRVCG